MLPYEADGVKFLKIVSLVWHNQRVEWSNGAVIAVKVSPVGIKPPAAVVMHISKGERHDLGAAAPMPTKASPPEQGRAGRSVESPPKLVKHVGSGSTRFAEQLSPCIA